MIITFNYISSNDNTPTILRFFVSAWNQFDFILVAFMVVELAVSARTRLPTTATTTTTTTTTTAPAANLRTRILDLLSYYGDMCIYIYIYTYI